jgi:hypothetical protein
MYVKLGLAHFEAEAVIWDKDGGRYMMLKKTEY